MNTTIINDPNTAATMTTDELINKFNWTYKMGFGIVGFDYTGMYQVERISEVNKFHSDEEAVEAAVKAGIPIIPVGELPEVFDRKYLGWIDTPDNRKAIQEYCDAYLK